jgi:hypothetical protein
MIMNTNVIINIILRILFFLISLISIFILISSLYNAVALTGGIYFGSTITYIYLVLLPLTGLGGIVHLIYLDDFIQISKNKKEAFKRFYYSVIICMLYIILGRSIEIYHIFYLTEKFLLNHFDYFILIFLLLLALMKFFINRKISLM